MNSSVASDIKNVASFATVGRSCVGSSHQYHGVRRQELTYPIGLHNLLHWERLSTDFADSHRFISKNCEIDLHFKTLPRWTVAGSLFPVREMPSLSRVEIVEEHS